MVIFRIIKKFRGILSQHQKVRVIELFILMVIGGFMEMLSVALIIPFIQTILNPEEMSNNPIVIKVMDFFGLQIYQTFLVLLALVMVAIYFAKNAFLVFQMIVQNRFVQNNKFAMQQRMFHNFLCRPYEFFLSANSGEIMRIISDDTSLAFVTLTTVLSFFSEMIVALTLMITVFIISPAITIAMGMILLIAVVVINLFTRGPVSRAGKKNQKALATMYQTLLQAIEGIKVVKLSRKENFFEKRYEKNGYIAIRTSYINMLSAVFPRYLIETFAMGGFFLILAGMIYSGVEIKSLLPAVTGAAMAAVRLLPCANRIASAISTLNFYEPSVDKMIENLNYLKDQYDNRSNSEIRNGVEINELKESIMAKDITYKYPTGEKFVLHGAQLEIKRGQSVGIVGTSGAGKTTAVDLILGLLQPQGGQILIDGTDIHLDMDGWLAQIGYIPQSIFMLDGNIRDNVAFGVDKSEVDDERVWKALRDASLEDFVKSLPEGIETQIGERGIRVSGGQKQRIGIARALYTNPEILFFDEATSALDNETESAIMESINHLQGTKTMIIIAHRLTTIENCDVVYRVEEGKIIMEKGPKLNKQDSII